MDVVVIVLVLGAIAVMIFKKPKSFIYYIAIIDIFLRILSFLGDNIPVKFITKFLNTYLPSSFPNIIDLYTSGLFATVLLWLLVVVYVMFLYYTIKVFLAKK